MLSLSSLIIIFLLLLSSSSSSPPHSLLFISAQSASITLGTEFRTTVKNSTISDDGRVRFYPASNNSNNTKQAYWCADTTDKTSTLFPTAQFSRICTALDMQVVTVSSSSSTPLVNIVSVSSIISADAPASFFFFNSVSCSFGQTFPNGYLDDCSATKFTTQSTQSVCSSGYVYQFFCYKYSAQNDPISAKADVFTTTNANTTDNRILLYRPSSAKTWGAICGIGTTDATKIAETARALCGMEGFRTAGATFIEYDPFTENPAASYPGIVNSKMYLSNVVCPPYALSIGANCTYDIAYSNSVTYGCPNAYPLRVQCIIPKVAVMPLVMRNGPSGRFEARSHCSKIWYSVCDDSFEAKDFVANCRMMGYATSLNVAGYTTLSLLFSSVGAFASSYASILSSTFIADDYTCRDPRVYSVYYNGQPNCQFVYFNDNCARSETLFLTPVVDPAMGSERTQKLCQDWTNLLPTNPFNAATQLIPAEDCTSDYYNSISFRDEDWNILMSTSFQIFLGCVGGIIFLSFCCSCFGCSQYNDESCCQRYSSCCDTCCEDSAEFCCSRTICCMCCSENAAEYCCQGLCTVCGNFCSHWAVMFCECGDGWPGTYQLPPGPARQIPLPEQMEMNIQNAPIQDGEAAIQVGGIDNHNNNADDDPRVREARRRNQELDEQEAAGTFLLSLKPADVSQRYALEQEARESVVKLLVDLGNNNLQEYLLVKSNEQKETDNKNNNNNTKINADDDDDAENFATPARKPNNNDKNPLTFDNTNKKNEDDDDDEDLVTQTVGTMTAQKTLFALTNNNNNFPNQITLEVPFTLARWWTRDFAAKIDFENDDSIKSFSAATTSSSSLLPFANSVELKSRLDKIFGSCAEYFGGYESYSGRFSLLVCVKKIHQINQNDSSTGNFFSVPSALSSGYRDRIIEVARATNISNTQIKTGDEKESREPFSQSNSAASQLPNSYSSFHFYRLTDFYRKLLKMSINNCDLSNNNSNRSYNFFSSAFVKLNPEVLFPEDDESTLNDKNDDGKNNHNETPSDAVITRSATAASTPFEDHMVVVEDDLLMDEDEQPATSKQHQAAKHSSHLHHKNNSSNTRKQLANNSHSWTFRCSVCFGKFNVDLPSLSCLLRKTASETVFPGSECSAPTRHFTCGPCTGKTISRFIEKGDVIFASLPCYNGDCAHSLGALVLNDFSSVLDIVTWRRWQDAIMERARLVGQREVMRGGPLTKLGGSADARGQAERIREVLKPKCPKCNLIFTSFTGCVQVKCVVGTSGAKRNDQAGTNNNVVKGCGTVFCGGCLKPQPCGSHSAHEFLSPAELHKEWSKWRRERVLKYLNDNFAPKSAAARDVLIAAQNVLVAASIWPLEEPWTLE